MGGTFGERRPATFAIPNLKGGEKCAIILWYTASFRAGTPPAAWCPGGSLPLKRTAPGTGAVPPEDVPVSAPRLPDTPAPSLHALHAAFLALILPKVLSHGRVYFRHLNAERKEEYIAEMVALAWKWHLRLAERGKDAAQFPTAIATFTARAVRSGRRLAGTDRAKDVLSPLAQRRKGFAVSKLPDGSTLNGSTLSEALRDNTRSPVDEQACFRLGFPAWLRTLTRRDRRLVEGMALGHRTLDLAREFRLSSGRVSQLRREFHREWQRFHGEDR
jgi:hypothetical protein